MWEIVVIKRVASNCIFAKTSMFHECQCAMEIASKKMTQRIAVPWFANDCVNRACNIPTMQFFTGISRNIQSKSYCYHWLRVSGNSKIMHCGILIDMPYWQTHNFLIFWYRCWKAQQSIDYMSTKRWWIDPFLKNCFSAFRFDIDSALWYSLRSLGTREGKQIRSGTEFESIHQPWEENHWSVCNRTVFYLSLLLHQSKGFT